MRKNKVPIIGVVAKHYPEEEIRPNLCIRDEVKQALFDNGAVVIGILLPKDEKKQCGDEWEDNFSSKDYKKLIAQINLCDGIVFQGGRVCDNYEMITAKYCYDNDIPTLGICCGQNVMARAIGGTTKLVDSPEKHNDKVSTYVHDVTVLKDTKFYNMVKKDKIKVNSRHNKTLDTYPNLKANCICEDGYIDGVEAENKTFYMAFRFHPESLYKIDENHNIIFKEFVDVCKKL